MPHVRKILQNWLHCSKEQQSFYLLTTTLLAIGIAWITLSFTVGQTIIVCPTKLLFNLPCPGCGMTRAINALCHGKFRLAIYYNVNCLIICPIIIFTFFSLFYDFFFGKHFTFRSYKTINMFISNKYFLVFFFILQALIVYHHLQCGI